MTEDQNKQPTAIDWNSIDVNDIPIHIIKAHPLYKATVRESIERRLELKQLRSKQLQEVAETSEVANVSEQTAAPDNNPPAWLNEFIERTERILSSERESMLETARDSAMRRYNLAESAREFLTGTSIKEIDAKAAKLAAMSLGRNTSAAAPAAGSVSDSKTANLINKLRNDMNPFSGASIWELQRKR